jgi:hypothetical protein
VRALAAQNPDGSVEPASSKSFVSGHEFTRADIAPKEEWALAPEPFPGLIPALWLDPDLRWLTGAHEAEGHTYIIREQYEELLWWLLMPSLLKLAIQPSPDRVAVEQLAARIQAALDAVKAAGYRIDTWLAPPAAKQPSSASKSQPIPDVSS